MENQEQKEVEVAIITNALTFYVKFDFFFVLIHDKMCKIKIIFVLFFSIL